MPFVKGQSGNPSGRTNKPWTEALQRELAQYAEGKIKRGEALRAIAAGVVQRAIAGDEDAVEEIAVRLDGRPAQSITGPDGGPVAVTWQPPSQG